MHVIEEEALINTTVRVNHGSPPLLTSEAVAQSALSFPDTASPPGPFLLFSSRRSSQNLFSSVLASELPSFTLLQALRHRNHAQTQFTMRSTLIFAGSSCPALTGQICENLGMQPAEAELTQFSNVSWPFLSQS